MMLQISVETPFSKTLQPLVNKTTTKLQVYCNNYN